MTIGKPLELTLRYGGAEAVHVFEDIGDFEVTLKELTAHSGIPVEVELVGGVSMETLLRLMSPEMRECDCLASGCNSPILRKLVAELVEKLKEAQTRGAWTQEGVPDDWHCLFMTDNGWCYEPATWWRGDSSYTSGACDAHIDAIRGGSQT